MYMPYSILMSVYKGEKPEYLTQSISCMLGQTAQPVEFVLVCDGPLTEALDAVIGEFERSKPGLFRIVRLRENIGLGPALGEGLRYCTNEYIVRMDSDDISREDRCEQQLRFLSDNNLDLCSAAVAEFTGESLECSGKRTLPCTHRELVRFARRRNPMNHPSVIFRKSKALEAGNYRNMPLFEDYDLWIRMIQKGARLGNQEEVLVYMRSSAALYLRRGGRPYVRANMRFWKTVYAEKFIKLPEYLFMLASRSFVCLLPNAFRAGLYRRWLRGKNEV